MPVQKTATTLNSALTYLCLPNAVENLVKMFCWWLQGVVTTSGSVATWTSLRFPESSVLMRKLASGVTIFEVLLHMWLEQEIQAEIWAGGW